MIKKLKIGLLIAVLSLAVGISQVNAAAGDLVWSADQNLDLTIDLVIKSGSTAESLVLTDPTITVNVASGDTFRVSTASAGSFTVDVMGGVGLSCNSSSQAQVEIVATSTQAYVITPSTTACVYSSGGGSVSSGGSSYVPPTTTVTTTTTTPTATTISGCEGRTTGFSTTNGLSCSGNTTTVTTTTPVVIAGCSGTTGFSTVNGQSCANNNTTVTTSTSYNLGTVTLKNGSKGDAVVQLQKILNKLLNLGLVEDGKLGPKTIAVIKQWQKNHGLVADGLVGRLTKAAMKAEAEE